LKFFDILKDFFFRLSWRNYLQFPKISNSIQQSYTVLNTFVYEIEKCIFIIDGI